MYSPRELNIVLLGRSGDGKSSTKNTILKEKSAQVRSPATSLVNQYQVKATNLPGKTLRIVETPGLFDTSRTKEEFQQEVEKCIAHCVPGLHAFIIILRVGRYTAQEARILDEIKELFGEEVLKYAVVLFTNGDQLDDGQTIEEFVQQGVALQDLVNKCGGRVHVIDNKYWKQQQDEYRNNRVQVEKLLKTIEDMVKENGGQYYSNEMLQAVKKNKRSGRLIRLFENVTQVVKKYTQGKGWHLANNQKTKLGLVGRYTQHEQATVKQITASFGEDALKYAVVLFTHGDELLEDQRIEDFVKQNKELQDLVNKCGGRVHVFDNNYWKQQQDGYRSNRVQVEKLLKTIEAMVKENGGQYNSNEMLRKINREIEAELEIIRSQLKGEMEDMKMREIAMNRVHEKMLLKLKGSTTEVLLGALFGVGAFLTIVLAILKAFH
ncbi:hypothetical protein AOLI_G00106170 [Acnodon oligacanthus]